MKNASDLAGIVACGGNSSRMGTDKSRIRYHGLPQYDVAAGLLAPFCKEVYLSVNNRQAAGFSSRYPLIPDAPELASRGPVAAVMSAFYRLPATNLIVVGCDYPLLTGEEIDRFLRMAAGCRTAAAFFNEESGYYEPVLAFYRRACQSELSERIARGNYSLQQFLKETGATRYIPADASVMTSVDTPAQAARVTHHFQQNNFPAQKHRP